MDCWSDLPNTARGSSSSAFDLKYKLFGSSALARYCPLVSSSPGGMKSEANAVATGTIVVKTDRRVMLADECLTAATAGEEEEKANAVLADQ